jgi:hypothetical protein
MTDEPEEPEVSADDLLGDGDPVEQVKKTRAKRAAPAAEDEPRLHPLFTNEEFRDIQAQARASVEKERKAKAKKALLADETERLMREEGLTTGSAEKDEIVDVLIDLPQWSPAVTINRFPYWHGRTYQVARHVADTLAESMHRAWRHEDQLDGKSKLQTMMRKRETTINARTGVAANVPVRFDA